jgi:tRNA(adenine34) deaminase
MTDSCATADETFMREALALAMAADREGDMGAGAIIVRAGRIVGRGRNRIRTRRDPTLHAETEAISDACRTLGVADLAGCVLYATMEPCPMCAGAIVLAGIARWVVGGRFKSIGRTDLGCYSIERFAELLARKVDLTSGVLQQECERVRRRWRP